MSTDTFFQESTEQSRIKAQIVSKYFWAWANVILSTVKDQPDPRIAYVDLFAGPGRYEDGTKSTPLLVLEHAIKEPRLCKSLVTIFNDAKNGEALSLSIEQLADVHKLKNKPLVLNQEVSIQMAREFAAVKMIPTFFFVDPWGYKGLSLELIHSVVRNWGSDCVFFFNYNRINMGLGNPAVADHIDNLFGKQRADRLRAIVLNLPPAEREATIVENLMEALRERGGKFVLPFCFKDEYGQRTSHHLIFVTKNVKGYDIMKDIMAKESSEQHQGVPSFGFCPASEAQPMLFELNRPLDDLEEMLLEAFAGQTLTTREIYDRHNVGRPFVLRNYKTVLLEMEERGVIKTDPPKRKSGTFGDKVAVSFPKRGIK